MLTLNCGRCHTCGTKLRIVLDGEEWCPTCGQYRRYRSHGWARGVAEESPCIVADSDGVAQGEKEDKERRRKKWIG
jgi:uncharacterized Zn finger protein (UPF0148 family)